MSSHGRTPQSVLDAPPLTPYMVSEQLGLVNGPNRVDRRHVQYRPRGKTYLIPKASREVATNVPFTRDQSFRRRGKKATRHALRFT